MDDIYSKRYKLKKLDFLTFDEKNKDYYAGQEYYSCCYTPIGWFSIKKQTGKPKWLINWADSYCDDTPSADVADSFKEAIEKADKLYQTMAELILIEV